MRCVFGGLPWIWACVTLTGYMPWGVPARGNTDPLIPPHFKTVVLWPRTVLLMSSDRIGQEMQDFARLCSKHHTVEPTSEIATAIPDSVVQRKKLHLSHD